MRIHFGLNFIIESDILLLLILRSTISYEICIILKITMERNTMEKFRYGTLDVAHNNVLYPLLAKYVLGQISF